MSERGDGEKGWKREWKHPWELEEYTLLLPTFVPMHKETAWIKMTVLAESLPAAKIAVDELMKSYAEGMYRAQFMVQIRYDPATKTYIGGYDDMVLWPRGATGEEGE